MIPVSAAGYLGYYPREVLEAGLWSPAVDVYALGMCFIHLLSGCQPYGFHVSPILATASWTTPRSSNPPFFPYFPSGGREFHLE